MCKRMLLAYVCLLALPALGGTVSGHAYYNGAYNNWQYAYAPTTVMFCLDDGVNGAYGRGQCVTATVGPVSQSSPYTINLPDNQYDYFFLFSDSADFGSRTSPAWSAPQGTKVVRAFVPSYGLPYPFEIYADPRPHAPAAAYPSSGQVEVNNRNVTLKWTSGIDAIRNWPGVWPVTYDIYGHGEGGTDLLQAANVPCNADVNGNCTFYVGDLYVATRYYWHVVAKLNTGNLSFNPYYTNSSAEFNFYTTCFDGVYWHC